MKVLVAAALAAGIVAAPAFASEDLAKAKNCLVCHTVDKQVIGPSYHDVAARYAGQADAVDTLTHSILEGSKGKWKDKGVRSPMPKNAHVKPEEAKQLAEWILTLK